MNLALYRNCGDDESGTLWDEAGSEGAVNLALCCQVGNYEPLSPCCKLTMSTEHGAREEGLLSREDLASCQLADAARKSLSIPAG